MRTLVGWSGGVESTGLMKYLLTETDDEIIAFHIYAPNSLKRADIEWKTTQVLNVLFQKIRPYQLMKVDITLPWDTCDPEVQATVLPGLMKGSKADRFLRGLCAEDLYPSGLHENRDRLVKWVNFWLKTDADISPDLPMFYWPKKQHMEYIKKYLPLTFSCLQPIDEKPCGTCRSCLLRNS